MLKVWNESGTNRGRIGDSRHGATSFTATYGAGPTAQYQIGCLQRFSAAAFGSQPVNASARSFFRRVKGKDPVDNGDSERGMMLAHQADASPLGTGGGLPSPGRSAANHHGHCDFTFAAARGGLATEMNCVACNTPVPTGVGSEKRYGTTTRVPAIGASQTSASRIAARYLIA